MARLAVALQSLGLKLTQSTPLPDPDPPPPVCSRCRGHGFVRRDVGTDHPDFGKAFVCECMAATFQQRRLARLFTRAELPEEEFGSISFASYRELADGDQDARERVEDWVLHGEKGLWLWGPQGAGKTGLAICAVRERLERQGITVLYRYAPDFFDDLRRGFDRELGGLSSGELFDVVRDTQLVLLDDVGKEHLTAWVRETFARLVDYRWRKHLPTIFTANEPPDSLDERLGPSVASRVKAMCWPYVIEVRSARDLR